MSSILIRFKHLNLITLSVSTFDKLKRKHRLECYKVLVEYLRQFLILQINHVYGGPGVVDRSLRLQITDVSPAFVAGIFITGCFKCCF